MKKTLLAAFVFVTSVHAHAEYQEITKINATRVTGYSAYTEAEVQTCTYSVISGSLHAGNPEEIVIFLNSDSASSVNESIRLSPEMVPLQEGTLISREGLSVEYRNGLLTKVKKMTTEGPFVNDYSIIQLKVSPDLKTIEMGAVKAAVKGIFREKILGQMACEFE